ncbi:hypothetical protein IEZ26_14145 [Nocardioides cavernae]|uniref:DUF4235 domain-containing protein n=1 Tax=Nocardioides cavernae TaxID=1921566 RepID=A0ABR8NDM5_9ACTN|nr:hypothetical protein [Nocardioides cavernae]MBD3925771.1 hypothetical protein [Nocardioides cavernae]MBM7513356.1 hypothetical protein [Nocardioides cavernae]
MDEQAPDSRPDSPLQSWPAHVATAVVTGVATTYMPVQRWSRPTRWALHGGMGALAAGAVGLFLRAPGKLVEPEEQDAPPFTLSPAAKAGIAVAFGTTIAAMSRGGQSADAWAEGALTRRGVRRPRLWMGVAAAGASLAVSASDKRRAAREQASSTS